MSFPPEGLQKAHVPFVRPTGVVSGVAAEARISRIGISSATQVRTRKLGPHSPSSAKFRAGGSVARSAGCFDSRQKPIFASTAKIVSSVVSPRLGMASNRSGLQLRRS